MAKLTKKSKAITVAAVSALLVGSAVATGIVFAKNKKVIPGKDTPGKEDPIIVPGDKPVFEPSVALSKTRFNGLDFELANLNSSANNGKKVKLTLINKEDKSKRQEQEVTVSSDKLIVTFDGLEENKTYLLELSFDETTKEVSGEFMTSKRPTIHSTKASSTNAVITLNNISNYQQDDLKKIEITISNKTNPSAEPIKVSADNLVIENGVARLNLKDANLGLEPGTQYEATIKYNEGGKSVDLAEPISITTPETTEVAYLYNEAKNALTFFGIKDNSKKVTLQYKLRGSSGEFTDVTSATTPVSGKVEIPLNADLGFDNTYVFQIKYENENDLLDLEGGVKTGDFTSQPAPKISASTENGLDIKVNKLSPNIDKTKIFVLYRDKDKGGEWTKKPLSEVLNKETNTLDIKDLNADTNYETRLVYETGEGDSIKTTILSETQFTTLKSFEFVLSNSFASANKVLLSFIDNNKSETNAENKYTGATLKYVKNGDAMYTAIQLTKKAVGDKTYAEANISSLDEKSLYNWILVDAKQQTIASGTFKTGKSLEGQSDFILVENNLTNGVNVSVANFFGYVESEGVKNYRPSDIQIKYYVENKQTSAQTETIRVSESNLQNLDYFSHNFSDLNNGNYVFEVSYDSVNPENNQETKINKTFNVNYKLPDVTFTNAESKLTITNLESLNGKNIVVKYKENNEENLPFEMVSGTVAEGKLEFVLEGLKSNTEYYGIIEVAQNDLQTFSSIAGKGRADFYGESSDQKISLPYSFATAELTKGSILVNSQKISSFNKKGSIKLGLTGFSNLANKEVVVRVGKASDLDSASLALASASTEPSAQPDQGEGVATRAETSVTTTEVYDPDTDYTKDSAIVDGGGNNITSPNIEARGHLDDKRDHEKKVLVERSSNDNYWTDYAAGDRGAQEIGEFSLHFTDATKYIGAIGLKMGRDNNTGSDGPRKIIVQTSENGTDWTSVTNQSQTTNFDNNYSHENIITFLPVRTQWIRIKYWNWPKNDSQFRMFKLGRFKVYGVKTVAENQEAQTYKELNGTINEDGELNLDNWVDNLSLNTSYDIRLYQKNEAQTELEQVAKRNYILPEVEDPKMQEISIVNSNTSNPGIKFNNFEEFENIIPENAQLQLRAKKISEGSDFENFTNVHTAQTFSPDENGQSFNEISFDVTLNQIKNAITDGVVPINRLITKTALLNWFIQNKAKYEIAFNLYIDDKFYVIAHNKDSNLLVRNSNPPRISGEATQTISKDAESNSLNNSVSLTLNALNDYDNADNPIKAYYIEADSPLASASPEHWMEKGNIEISAENHNSTVSFDNLKPDTVYKVAFVDKDGNILLSNDRVKTRPVPKLKNTTHGDVLMKYTLSNLKGAQSVITAGTYKILFSEDKSYGSSSDEVTVGDVTNFDGSYTFTLQNLKPNTTYNYKLVRGDNNETVLSYEDSFKTNKSQNEETVVGNDFASIKIVNPDYRLREGFYSIARKVTEGDEDKMVLDLLKFQYSKNSDFTDAKEFSVSLSENESDLLALRLNGLEANTTYYYKLVKGTAKTQVIKNSRSGDSAATEPVVEWESTAALSGSFKTLNIEATVVETTNKATLTFANTNVTELNELGLKYKKQGNSNTYDVAYDYKVENGNVVFELNDLDKETIYDYTLFNLSSGKELAINDFTTKTDSQIKTSLSQFDGTHVRFKLTNLNDFVGRKVRFVIKEMPADTVTYTAETTLTNENNEFMWDVEDLAILDLGKKYLYNIYLLKEDGNVDSLVDTGEFNSDSKYTSSGDLKVTTNVRTSGNYDLNKWYTLTTLQEIYATEKTWKNKVKESLEEIAIFGSNVDSATSYGWHKLIVEGSEQRYFVEEGDKVVYSYIFVEPVGETERAILKGIKFELQLVGNTIQVKILEAKSKPGDVDKRINVKEYTWDQLTETIAYKAPNGVVNQNNKDIAGDFISVGGFKFKASTVKRNSRDFSIPQVFRYSLEEARPALNQKTPSKGTNTNNGTAAGFVNLNNGAQKAKYGEFNNTDTFNYDVAYEKYVLDNKELLPVNGNFMINASMVPGFSHMNKDLYTPGLSYDAQLRAKFFKLLQDSGQIRFTGADTVNRNWISFNSEDVVMFADEEFAESDKYLSEFKLAKRLIWRDGNQLKGLRLTLSDSKDGNGALLGQLDDFVYYLDITKDINLQTISWETFTSLATKHTVHKYMNTDSAGTAIAGIRFATKDKSFISTSNETKFVNPQSVAFSAAIETNSTEGESQTRKIKLYNAEVGEYTLKVEYPIFYPTNNKTEYNDTTTFTITEDDKNYHEIDLTQYLQYNTEYKVTLKKGHEVLKVLTGINANIPGGFTYFGSGDIKSVSAGEYYVDRNNKNRKELGNGWPPESQRRFSINATQVLGIDNPNSDEGMRQYRDRVKSILVGSTRLSTDGTMRYKWAFKTQHSDWYRQSTARQAIYGAVLSDDRTKIIIVEIAIQTFQHSSWFYTRNIREYTVQNGDLDNLSGMNLQTKFRDGRDITREAILDSAHITEESLQPNGENYGKVGFFGFFIKDKETPASGGSN